MKTLGDYIKGYPRVEVYLLMEFIVFTDKGNIRYQLCKQPGYNSFYYMKGDEVIEKKYIAGDHLEKLSIQLINHKNDESIKKAIEEQVSFQHWKKFIKEQTGKDIIL